MIAIFLHSRPASVSPLVGRPAAMSRARRETMLCLLAAVALLSSAAFPLPAKAQMDSVSGVIDWFKGKGGATQRNAENKERILSVLTHQGVVSIRDGRVEVNNQSALTEYYNALRETNALKKMPDYADDERNEKSGQFWRNFFDGKDHTQPGLPPAADPFANANSELATKMHVELQAATHLGGLDYAMTASDLKLRHIDVMDAELRRGVATGAKVMIQSLNTITGGTSSQAVKWMEEAAEAAKKAGEDPTGAAKDYLKSKVDEHVRGLVDDKVKSAMGEDNYDKIMSAYEKYGSKQQRLKAFMDDMYKKTGDGQFDALSKLVDKASTDEIAKSLTEKSKALIEAAKAKASGEDKDKDKGKGGDKDKAADKDKVSEKKKAGDKETAEKEKSAASDKVTAGSDKKSWDQMSKAEKRGALKANDPDAWDAFGKLVAISPDQAVAILDATTGAGGAKDKTAKNDGVEDAAPDLGQAIADAGSSGLEQTPAPQQTVTTAQPPSSPATTEVEGGTVQDSNGTTKVIYINDANGNRIGGYYVHYDPSGREIGRETFKETANNPPIQQPAVVLSGHYRGRISGRSSGSIAITVAGSSISGSISGVHEGDSFSASFSGSIGGDGSFDVPAQGVLQGKWGDHVTPYPLSGHVSGRVDGRAGAGRWSGRNQYGTDGGTWKASK